MKRIVLTEGSYYSKSIEALGAELGVDPYDLLLSLEEADSRISKRLSVSGVLSVDKRRFSFNRVAGVFPVSNSLEIEIIPKFLSKDDSWRADFLLMLSRSRWGIIAERQLISASRDKSGGINDALALVFLSMFDSASHVPIRKYRRYSIEQYEVEGDLEEESVLIPGKDGFVQSITEYTKKNDFNAVISEAALILIQATSDFELKGRLERAVNLLGPQGPLPYSMPKIVPSRFGHWERIYRLSEDILNGYGIDYLNQGEIDGPSFLVRTSDAWEEFLRQALVLGLKECRVSYQQKHPFAKKAKSLVKVRPDYTINNNEGKGLLVDAKYKYSDASAASVSNADIYEGWAFMKASGVPRLILLYPFVPERSTLSHPFEEFSRIQDEDYEIVAVRVNPSIAANNSMNAFASELASFLDPYFI